MISSIVAILTPIVGVIRWLVLKEKPSANYYLVISIIILAATVIVLVIRVAKYRKLSKARIAQLSEGVHNLTHNSRDTYFDILHAYKLGTLNVEFLTKSVETCAKDALDALCKVMGAFTGQDVSACIKLIESSQAGEEIDLQNAKIRVFCRSRNSDSRRINYDNSKERETVYIKDDTALMRIVGSQAGQKAYFYCGDLDKFERSCKEAHEEYLCPNRHRADYYSGTIILPIRVLFKKLYYYNRDEAYHIIGFLCIDSLSKNAFQDNQEIQNCHLGNAYADEFYVLFSKYRHYLDKLAKGQQSAGRLKENANVEGA